jgi:DNA-binding transcriptional LysR family regulator
MARDVFATLDLNLLRTLRVLHQEQNMRRASERLFVSQPAVSQALKKLRHHFPDELFIKTPAGLKPTSFTDDLMEQVGPLLDGLSSTLNQGETFDPAAIGHDIRIALAPHMISYLSSRLFKDIRAQAPGAEVRIEAWTAETLENLVKGDLHLGVSLELSGLSRELECEPLADDFFRVYAREGHPVLGEKKSLTLKDLDGCEIASLLVPDFNYGETHIERILKANGYRATVGFRCSLSSSVTEVLRSSDMVYGASSFIELNDLEGLRTLDLRVNNQQLCYPVTAYYHRRNQKNPFTRWLTGLVAGQLQQ